MDAMAAIGQRVAEIAARVADPGLAVSATAAGAASGPSGSAFAAALAEALAADGTTSGAGLAADGTTSGAALAAGSGSTALDGPGVSTASLMAALGLSGGGGSSTSGLSSAAVLQALGLAGPTGVTSLGGTGRATTPGVTGPSGLDAHGVPTDLAAYGNGRVPASALAPVGTTGARMWQPAAQALTDAIAAAKADGVTIGVTEGYRPYAEQVSLAAAKGLYAAGGLAAAPGTSEHGWGMAADLRLDASALAWMRANGGRFGFVESTPREPWHWSYRPGA